MSLASTKFLTDQWYRIPSASCEVSISHGVKFTVSSLPKITVVPSVEAFSNLSTNIIISSVIWGTKVSRWACENAGLNIFRSLYHSSPSRRRKESPKTGCSLRNASLHLGILSTVWILWASFSSEVKHLTTWELTVYHAQWLIYRPRVKAIVSVDGLRGGTIQHDTVDSIVIPHVDKHDWTISIPFNSFRYKFEVSPNEAVRRTGLLSEGSANDWAYQPREATPNPNEFDYPFADDESEREQESKGN